jgi:chromate transporter
MISRECVDEEGWVDEETFKKTLAVYQVLPGPEAHELCVYFGRLRAGKLGGLVAGLGFMLPGFLLMLGLSVLYVEAGLSERFEELFYGLNAAVGALVAMAIVRLGRKFINDVPLALIAVASLVLTLGMELSFLLVLVAAGIAYELWTRAGSTLTRSFTFEPLTAMLVVLGAVTLSLAVEIFLEGLKAGLLTFGGAYTVIPWLQESAVDNRAWLTESQFLDGLALSGVLPAPLIIFSTFVGYVGGGPLGALAMTLGIFLPAFCFTLVGHDYLERLINNTAVHTFLDGVTAGVVGLIAATTLVLFREGITSLPALIIFALALAAVYLWKAKAAVAGIVLGAGVLGLLLF